MVRPFKPQNMSNNAAVTEDGGEIGRAQALQALAARVAPSVHMNPVLLKPQSEIGAQVIIQGKIFGSATAREMQDLKPRLLPYVLESFGTIRRDADIVLVEGAGSASEINLRKNDIANMGFARAADVPVVVIGDIDRGGVIASLVGTKAVLDAEDAKLVAGFIVNRMRGDISLFADGMEEIALRTRLAGARACAFLRGRAPAAGGGRLRPRRTAALSGQRQGQSGGAAPAAYRQFRRSRSIRRGTRRRIGHGRAWHATAGLRSHRCAGLKIDHRRLQDASRSWLGHRYCRACAARRTCAWALRRLSDAGGQHRRSAWHRRPGRIGARLEPVAGRHGHRRREGARRSQRHDCCRCRARQRL